MVFIVVFVFLQDFRSTLIPAIAVPVARVGTFFFLQVFGFTINLLTLFALVLAIGIVVDDAIVVVEAVHSKMEQTFIWKCFRWINAANISKRYIENQSEIGTKSTGTKCFSIQTKCIECRR